MLSSKLCHAHMAVRRACQGIDHKEGRAYALFLRKPRALAAPAAAGSFQSTPRQLRFPVEYGQGPGDGTYCALPEQLRAFMYAPQLGVQSETSMTSKQKSGSVAYCVQTYGAPSLEHWLEQDFR